MIFNYYQIVNLQNDKIYIGITEKNPEIRFKQHIKMLKNHTHPNYKLQKDWNVYGQNNFAFSIIETLEADNIEKGYYREYELIQKSDKELYNIAPGGKVNPIYSKDIYEKMIATKRSQVPNIYNLEEVDENIFKIIECFPSQKNVQKVHPQWYQANIGLAIHKHHMAYGYFWITQLEVDNHLEFWKPLRKRFSPVALLDDNDNIINVHYSPKLFEQDYNYTKGIVSASICHKNKCHGQKYQYISEDEYYIRKPVTLIL